jgi:hypothetical protein
MRSTTPQTYRIPSFVQVADPPKAATAKVQNKFSALNMDSDSD